MQSRCLDKGQGSHGLPITWYPGASQDLMQKAQEQTSASSQHSWGRCGNLICQEKEQLSSLSSEIGWIRLDQTRLSF